MNDPQQTVMLACADMLKGAGIEIAVFVAFVRANTPKPTPKHALARAMAERPEGVSSAEIESALGISRSRTSEVLGRVRQDVPLIRVAVSKWVPVRHFVHKAHADAFLASLHAPPAESKGKSAAPGQSVSSGHGVRRVPTGKPGHLLVAKPADKKPAPAPQPAREVVIPANVKRVVVPTPIGRFEVPVGAQLTGGFSSSRPGVNPMTGKGWDESARREGVGA